MSCKTTVILNNIKLPNKTIYDADLISLSGVLNVATAKDALDKDVVEPASQGNDVDPTTDLKIIKGSKEGSLVLKFKQLLVATGTIINIQGGDLVFVANTVRELLMATEQINKIKINNINGRVYTFVKGVRDKPNPDSASNSVPGAKPTTSKTSSLLSMQSISDTEAANELTSLANARRL